MITEDMVRAAAEAIYNVWAKNREVEATWEECVRLKHSIAREAEEEGRAAITAALAAMWQDHVIVPREATEEMIDAACVAQIALYPAWEGQKPSPTAGEVIATVYRAMVSAAPTLLSTRMGSEKTAESGHSPSTHNSESE